MAQEEKACAIPRQSGADGQVYQALLGPSLTLLLAQQVGKPLLRGHHISSFRPWVPKVAILLPPHPHYHANLPGH